MIYKISAVNMPAAFKQNARLIAMNQDKIHGLMTDIVDTAGVNIIESYEDSELSELQLLPEWDTV